MTGQRLMLAVVLVVMVGCESADRRAFNDQIDQLEVDATERVEIYESFEAELVAELAEVYGARPSADDGCPQIEPIPSVGAGLRLSLTREEMQHERQREIRAAREVWERNVPGEHCRCLQGTIVNVRRAIAGADRDFDGARAVIADMSDEALAQRAAQVAASGGFRADEFSLDVARDRVAAWKTRRHEDWRGDPDRWREGEEKHGWEQYEPWYVSDYSPSSWGFIGDPGPVLTGLSSQGTGRGCDQFRR